MKKLFVLVLITLNYGIAQPIQLDMNVFAVRRNAFMQQMDSNSIAVFPCKPEYQRNLDVEYEYRQESNFYYLSGFEEQEAVLILNPYHPNYKFIMVVRKRDSRRETYEGPRAGVEGAMTSFKADTSFLYDDLESAIWFARPTQKVYYSFGINEAIDKKIQLMFVNGRSGMNWQIIDPAPIVNEMRVIKNDDDWRMGLQKAIDISANAHIAAMKAIRPTMNECEIQAEFEYVYRKSGSPRNGYPCIVGSGPNSTILHYDKNNRVMRDGEIVLMDCAAEYGYYSADITRTVPVNGKFSQEQRVIYEIVLAAQEAAMRLVKPGIQMKDLSVAIDSVLGEGLLRLGFIKDKKDFRMFSLHGYSHWIGLDVHDVGSYTEHGQSRMLVSGMVFTIEPGIYVRSDVFDKMKSRGYTNEEIETIRQKVEKYMNIGVRIEDDILVTNDGYRNLSASAPREIDAIEKMMARSKK